VSYSAHNAYNRGYQPFQACGPIDKQTEDPWPTHCTNSPMRQKLHITEQKWKQRKTIF